MLGGELVVGLDLVGGFGTQFLVVLANDRRDIADAHAPARKRKRVMNEYCEPSLGQLVGPAHAAVVKVAVLAHHRVNRVSHLGDLAPAKILVAAMIVQRQHGGESAPGVGRFQEHGLCWRPVRKLPCQMLDVQAVIDELVLNLAPGTRARVRAGAGNRAAAPRLGPPRVNRTQVEPRLAERQPRRPRARQPRCPRAIRPDHVRVHCDRSFQNGRPHVPQ